MRRRFLKDCALVFIGGGTGALVRVACEVPEMGPLMPANFAACFLIGLSAALAKRGMVDFPWYKPLVHLGFLGGLSTFSVLSVAAWLSGGGVLAAAGCLFLFLAIFFAAAMAGYETGLHLWSGGNRRWRKARPGEAARKGVSSLRRG